LKNLAINGIKYKIFCHYQYRDIVSVIAYLFIEKNKFEKELREKRNKKPILNVSFDEDVLKSWMTDIVQEDVNGVCTLTGKTIYNKFTILSEWTLLLVLISICSLYTANK